MKTFLLRASLAGMFAASSFYAQSPGALAGLNAPLPVRYTVTDLGPVGGAPGQPLVILNNGLIGGSAAVADTTWHAFFWYQGMKIDIGKTALGGPSSTVFGANERGQAVGEAETADPDPSREDFCGFGSQHVCLPFLWQYGVMTPLPTLVNSTGVAAKNALANAINNRGEIAGASENGVPDSTCPPFDPPAGQHQKIQFKPVTWTNGKIQELPTVGSDPDGMVFSVNDQGQAAGASGSCTTFQANGDLTYLYGQHATIWQNGTVMDLGNLGGVAPGGGNVALHINRWGQVVGLSGTANGSFHGFLWSQEVGIQDVGVVQNDAASVALSNNDRGDIVGISFDAESNPRAFLRPDGGSPVDLNSLLPANSPLFLFDACSINSSGEIIGIALDETGAAHGYLATPANAAPVSSFVSEVATNRCDSNPRASCYGREWVCGPSFRGEA